MTKEIAKLKDADFTERIEFVKKVSMGVPKMMDIDLGVLLTDQEYNIAGNLFYILSAPDENNYVNIKVNETREPAIPYTVHMGLETPFYRLFITTPAGQVGTMQIIYGTEAPEFLRLIDNRSTTTAGLIGIFEELRGDTVYENYSGVTVGIAAGVVLAANADRKACIIQALSTNTGRVFFGFTNAVNAGGAPGTWFAELQPGQAFAVDDYRGPIYGIATAAGQVVGVGEW